MKKHSGRRLFEAMGQSAGTRLSTRQMTHAKAQMQARDDTPGLHLAAAYNRGCRAAYYEGCRAAYYGRRVAMSLPASADGKPPARSSVATVAASPRPRKVRRGN